MQQYRPAVKWTIIYAISLLSWMVIERLAGLHDEHIRMHPVITSVFFAVMLAIYWFYIKEKEATTEKKGFVATFKNGLVLTAMITVISPVLQYVISTIITPNYFTNVINYTVKNSHMTLEEAKEYFSLSNYVRQSVFGTAIFGTFFSLVIAGIRHFLK